MSCLRLFENNSTFNVNVCSILSHLESLPTPKINTKNSIVHHKTHSIKQMFNISSLFLSVWIIICVTAICFAIEYLLFQMLLEFKSTNKLYTIIKHSMCAFCYYTHRFTFDWTDKFPTKILIIADRVKLYVTCSSIVEIVRDTIWYDIINGCADKWEPWVKISTFKLFTKRKYLNNYQSKEFTLETFELAFQLILKNSQLKIELILIQINTRQLKEKNFLFVKGSNF